MLSGWTFDSIYQPDCIDARKAKRIAEINDKKRGSRLLAFGIQWRLS